MKPSSFAYERAESKEHALQLLAEYGDDAKVIAGGQSLGPLLNMRLATPLVLIDINDLCELTSRQPGGGGSLRVGALSRHRTLETAPDVASGWPLLSEAVSFIGHRAIRNRGTIGGSLVHADPAAELPAVTVALGATIITESLQGVREIAAKDFFQSFYTCAIRADELVTDVVFPAAPPRCGASWIEFAPRHGDYGYVGVAAVVALDDAGRCRTMRLVYSGVASVPLQAAVGDTATGSPLDHLTIDRIATGAATEINPTNDSSAPSGYKQRLIDHLTRTALYTIAMRATK